MDMESIATLVSSALMVLREYALRRGAEVAAVVAKEAITLAADLLQTVRAHFETQTEEKAQKALANYVDEPEDYEAVFEKYLARELEAHETFRQEVLAFLERIQKAVPEAGISTAVGGSGAVAMQGGVAAGEGGTTAECQDYLTLSND